MLKKIFIIALILSSGLFHKTFAQTNDSISKLLIKDLENIYSQNQIIGFSVAIVNQNGSLFEKGFGYSNKKENKKYTEKTIQNIASISKTF
ncbi:MAG: serine hydrolase, partial [Flavobacteriaceae bacterium]